MTSNNIIKYIKNPGYLDVNTKEVLERIIDAYPFFHTAHMLYIKNLNVLNDDGYCKYLEKYAVFLNRKNLFDFIQQKNIQKLTDDILFELDEDKEVDVHVVVDDPCYISDYFPVSDELIELDESDTVCESPSEEKEINVVDCFIQNNPVFKPVSVQSSVHEDISKDSVTEHDDIITEKLAKFYLSKKLYKKAIHAFEVLSLKYPEKSIYFAEQIERIYSVMKDKSNN